ncbi:MAG: hypothetical protein ACYTEP_04425 [Planctomycetota bacterium]|jgi:hypothetical protein
MASEKTARSRWPRILLVIAVLGVMGIGIFAVMLRNWTVARSFGVEQAEVGIQEILDGLSDARPYLEILEDGTLHRNVDLETEDAADVASLSIVLWNPNWNRWIHTDFPYWFVRMKMRHGIPLGPIRNALDEDWAQIPRELRFEILERRGPGMILHQVADDGRQILIWNVASETD